MGWLKPSPRSRHSSPHPAWPWPPGRLSIIMARWKWATAPATASTRSSWVSAPRFMGRGLRGPPNETLGTLAKPTVAAGSDPRRSLYSTTMAGHAPQQPSALAPKISVWYRGRSFWRCADHSPLSRKRWVICEQECCSWAIAL
jgi:hypothetical protein